MNIKRLLCCLAALLCVQVASAQAPTAQGKPAAQGAQQAPLDVLKLTEAQIGTVSDVATLQTMVNGYRKVGDVQRMAWSLARLTVVVPNSYDYKMSLAVLYAQMGEKAKTYDLLLKMKAQGYGADLANDKRFAKVADTEVWGYVTSNLSGNLATFGEGKVAFDLPNGDTLFESLAWDPKRKQLLVGSARDGKILLAGTDGKLKDFISPDASNGLWSVYGMAVDAERDLLYVASTASVFFKGFGTEDFGKAGVFKFQLSSGKLLAKYLLAGGGVHTLSTITVGKGGQMFVADGVRNIIYKIEGSELKVAVSDPNLMSVRGLAVSDDGKMLYFADYMLGLYGVHLATGTGFEVDYNRDLLVLGGIDGLYWYDGTLVAVENGMQPQRVIRLSLSPEGRSITKVMPLDVANPAFKLPTYGTVAGDQFYFVANSQKGAYGQYGEIRSGAKTDAVRIFRSNLRFAWNEGGIATSGLPVRTVPFEEGKKLMQQRPNFDDPLTPPGEAKPAENPPPEKKKN